ncbi:Eco57I restriction-modification methylase domain-containing protein [Leptospira yasudae]|uniref:site-specific DNA-methyltransferase (adenine-specific) n=1 Tax=Leptospira yasudae TaxID=2202201 RepID=A0ABX9LX90_9LEPT|nr:TaqI-like C-terminal specificity domain-containing protein [Leptospira yasudae]RHX77470.1 hypothetical protein DLM77_21115 [Leptospira yasudae]
MNRESGKKIIQERVKEFEKNKAVLTKKGHGETNIRSNYIDVMFEALGWDMKSHYEVVREYSQRDRSNEGGTKKVDYAFKINGKLKFFIEAKEASVDLENDKGAIYQAKRYAYSSNGKAPIVILTDFEEFRVFSVLKAPLIDYPNRELIESRSMVYTSYLENWDLIWDTFSKEAVSSGSLDKLIGRIDRNAKLMDDDFLEQISSWREELAKNIALRNKNLSIDELNESVQRILDRLIFIRNLEDREIEPENTLFDASKKPVDIYSSLIPIFQSLDKTYNGLLFKKHFSESVIIDDITIKNIIKKMCYPLSPFQFDIIEPEILGRIYEKFLGSRIRLTEGHRAKIEEKIEVRKAGGVFYTPEYIVNYIVKNTVGKRIDGLSPEEIKKIKIVDPACGSGSFLLGAYNYILEYHERWYSKNQSKQKFKPDWYKNSTGEIKVTIDKRGEILKDNIFGVDIDKEATEVAIMSLYLKMLEGGFDLGQKELFFGKGSILPEMSGNIQCGNSLIEEDFFQQYSLPLAEELEMHFVTKPFNWKIKFPNVFSDGGFDIVIGNPPYGATLLEYHISYYENRFRTYEYQPNSFAFFIEAATALLKENGLISYIVPAVLHNQHYFSQIRKFLLNDTNLDLIHLFKYKVFENAETGDTLIFVSSKTKPNDKPILFRTSTYFSEPLDWTESALDKQSALSNQRYELTIGSGNPLVTRILENSVSLSSVANCVMGIKPYQTGKGKPKQTQTIVSERPFDSPSKIDSSFKPYIVGKDINRYSIKPHHEKYIKYGEWLAEPRPDAPFEREKIVCRQTSDHIIASLDHSNYYNLNNVYNIESINPSISNTFLLGLLNSKLFVYLYYEIVGEKGRTFAEIKKVNLNKLPIVFNNRDLVLKIEDKVVRILKAHDNLKSAKSESDRTTLNDYIQRVESEIDQLIFALYNLTADEISMVKSSI